MAASRDINSGTGEFLPETGDASVNDSLVVRGERTYLTLRLVSLDYSNSFSDCLAQTQMVRSLAQQW